MSVARLVLGADTLCWHQRIEHRELTVEQCLAEAADAGASFVQVSLHHVRDRSPADLSTLARHAGDLGLRLLASGDPLGGAHRRESPEAAAARVEIWIERAVALGSPVLRVASGFYRADLAAVSGAIESERRWTIDALGRALPAARAAAVTLAVENHSDFTATEYHSIVQALPEVRVFLDVINPISAFEDPVPVIRSLAPLAVAGHIKDYELRSIWTEGEYHRRGFSVLWRYPGEGVADLRALLAALGEGLGSRELSLSVEGLDSRPGVSDQVARLRAAFDVVRDALATSA